VLVSDNRIPFTTQRYKSFGFDNRDITKPHKISHILADTVRIRFPYCSVKAADVARSQALSGFLLVATVLLADGLGNRNLTKHHKTPQNTTKHHKTPQIM
jgi:hypothetical protein